MRTHTERCFHYRTIQRLQGIVQRLLGIICLMDIICRLLGIVSFLDINCRLLGIVSLRQRVSIAAANGSHSGTLFRAISLG